MKNIFFPLFVILILSFSIVSAEDIYSDLGDVELQQNAGLTPDDTLYFMDDFFESAFIGNNPKRALSYKDEKIAEARQMIEEGKIDEAKKALESVEKYSDVLQREVSPDIEREVRESSKAVKEVLRELDDKIEGEDWNDVRKSVDEHDEREDEIALTAQITSEIQDLCEKLSQLDPLEYSRVCRTDEGAPKWQQKLDEELTGDQEKEAKEFFGIMSQCFQNPRECQCDSISVPAFADKCNEIAPIAVACDEGDDNACQQMEEIDDPIELLPDYLQDVLAKIEDKYGEDKFEHFMPLECEEVGATTKEACEEVMFKIHSPEPCVRALEDGRITGTNERESREQCEKIMFEDEAPEECLAAGVTNFEDCGSFMFKQHAPQECLDAGLTGESRSDEKECRELSGGMHENGDYIAPGGNCQSISDPMERLACYDSAVQGVGERWEAATDLPQECIDVNAFEREACDKHLSDVAKWKEEEAKMAIPEDLPQNCIDVGALSWDACNQHNWDVAQVGPGCGDCQSKCPGASRTDCVNDRCECYYDDSGSGGGDYEESECKDGCSDECPGASGTDCVDGGTRCACYYEDDSSSDDDDDWGGSGTSSGGGESSEPTSETETSEPSEPSEPSTETDASSDSESEESPDESSSNSESSDSTSSDSDDSESSDSSSGDSESNTDSSSGGEITGGIILIDNDFLNYFFKI